ncbi:MAG TPA: SprT family zinc-dependent metalloprotease [Candidatus Saccharimonadales bacterium]|nr:SprT family zinc-dependent metalloprotease [Candidatus Saccharimonadales bacterium]
MSQKSFLVDGVGQITIYKRHGAKNVRLSLSASGKVRVSQPYFTPYQAGIAFVKKNRTWLMERAVKEALPPLASGQQIGKKHQLIIARSTSNVVSTHIKAGVIKVRAPASASRPTVQEAAVSACERALKKEAEELLVGRLAELARQHGFSYQSARIKKLTARWGSCSSDRVITLSYYLVQLPWELIDYVILHELTHTRQMNHGPKFWQELTTFVPDARARQKWIRQHKPRLAPNP